MDTNEIFCKHSPKENYKDFAALLDHSGLGNEVQKLPSSVPIYIKINAMVYVHPDYINYTSPTQVIYLVKYLRAKGCKSVFLVESKSMYSVVFPEYTVKNVLTRLGLDPKLVIDLSDTRIPFEYKGEKIEMPSLLDRNTSNFFLIDFPKLKTHNHLGITLAIKNMYGCLPEPNKYISFHQKMNLHDAIAAIHHFVQPDFVILDAIIGQQTFLDFPKKSDLGKHYEYGYLFAGRNPLLMDEFIGDLMGFDIFSLDSMKQVAPLYGGRAPPRYIVTGDIPPRLKGFKAYNSFTRNMMMRFVNKIPITESMMKKNVWRFRKNSMYDEGLFKLEK